MTNWDDCEKANAVLDLYGNSSRPAVVVDSRLYTVWANNAALILFPFLRMPDGMYSFLGSDGVRHAQEVITCGESFVLEAGILLPKANTLFFSPIAGEGEDVFALCLMRVEGEKKDSSATRAVSTFSSQIRAPLTQIFSSLSVLSRTELAAGLEPLQKSLKNINQNSYRILRQCMNLTEYAQLTSTPYPSETFLTDLSALVGTLCKSARILTRETKVELDYNVPPQALYCKCDSSKLELALLNILSNACRFSEAGGRISIILEQRHSIAKITITDHGLGIDPDVLPDIFNPFFSANNGRGEIPGGGLGLTVAKLSIEANGGTLAVHSTPGSGTTAALTLPLVESRQSQGIYLKSPSMLEVMCDRFSLLYVLLSDVCKTPWP